MSNFTGGAWSRERTIPELDSCNAHTCNCSILEVMIMSFHNRGRAVPESIQYPWKFPGRSDGTLAANDGIHNTFHIHYRCVRTKARRIPPSKRLA